MPADRSDDHLALAARLDAQRQVESVAARALIEAFVARARDEGVEAQLLKARSRTGKALLKTNVTGWYIKRDHSLGVGVDGQFYILGADDGLKARLKGVVLTPSDPPLEIGRGARDGESMPLETALELRLAAGNDF